MKILQCLWRDQAGFVISSELVLVATILVVGMTVGLTSVRDQTVQELADVGAAISQVNQSFSFSGITGHHSSTAGSAFFDLRDRCDEPEDVSGWGALCVNVCGFPATDEGFNQVGFYGGAFGPGFGGVFGPVPGPVAVP